MKILLFTDNHFSETSSIIRSKGKKYSTRLENQIESLNYVEDSAIKYNCDMIICLGDFFDKSTLTDQELTALKDIKWSNIPHYFIVGNHESSVNGLSYNSTKALERSNFTIVDKISKLNVGNRDILFLPYCLESDRKSLSEYWSEVDEPESLRQKGIILSHNDIKGLQMGAFLSKEGIDIKDIESNCALFINGHLHNGTWFSSKARNLGNLTGQNFSEDASKYEHIFSILDTDTLEMKDYSNIFAFNFYKLEIDTPDKIKLVSSVKNNSVLSIKCKNTLVDKIKEIIKSTSKIIEYRIISYQESEEIINEVDISSLTLNHLEKFVEFCKEKIGVNDIVLEELNEVCK